MDFRLKKIKRSESYLTATNSGCGGKLKFNTITYSDSFDQSNRFTRITSTIVHRNRMSNKNRNRIKKKRKIDSSMMVNNETVPPRKETENDFENLYCNKFLADNSSILDSPIHLLWKFKKENVTTSTSKVFKINKNDASFFYFKDLISIFLSIIILLSTIFSLEIINILWFDNKDQNTGNYGLITFKMSFFLTNIFSIMLLLSSNSRFIAIKSLLSKPNSSILFSLLCFLYVSILSNLFISNFISKNLNDKLTLLILQLKILLEISAGFFYSLFNITTINFLCFFSDYNFQQSFSKNRFFILKNYQNTFLSFFVLFQTNTIYSSIVFLSSLYLISEETVKEKFCNVCSNFIKNSSSFCPIVSLFSFKENFQLQNKNDIFSCFSISKLNFDAHYNKTESFETRQKEFLNFVNLHLIAFGVILFNFFVSVTLLFLFICWKNKKRIDEIETICRQKTRDIVIETVNI